MPSRLSHRVHGRQRGAELVEFAAVLPCLVLLTLLVSEAAGMIGAHQVLINAAREGARLAVVPGELNASGDVTQRVVAYAAASGLALTSNNVSVNQNEVVATNGACSAANPCLTASKVTVSYNYPLVFLPRLPFGLPSTVGLGASVEMRNFY